MKIKVAKAEYLEQAEKLSANQIEGLLNRMGGKLPHRLDKEKITQLEALAIQLEIEHEQLNEWREKMYAIQSKQKQVIRQQTDNAQSRAYARPL